MITLRVTRRKPERQKSSRCPANERRRREGRLAKGSLNFGLKAGRELMQRVLPTAATPISMAVLKAKRMKVWKMFSLSWGRGHPGRSVREKGRKVWKMFSLFVALSFTLVACSPRRHTPRRQLPLSHRLRPLNRRRARSACSTTGCLARSRPPLSSN